MRKPAYCYSDPASEDWTGCKVPCLSPTSRLPRGEEALRAWAQAHPPWSSISLLPVSPQLF